MARKHEPVFGGSYAIKLRSGATLRCGKEARAAEFWVALEGQQVTMRVPNAGYGGSELVVSPDQRWAALFVYSGQSDQGYELFALEPALKRVGGLPYVYGEGTVPVFSPDSRWLAMVMTTEQRVRDSGDYAEEILEDDAEGDVFVDWAKLYAQQLPDGPINNAPVGTTIARSMSYDDLCEWNLYNAIAYTANDRLSIKLPWGGKADVKLPLSGPITTPR